MSVTYVQKLKDPRWQRKRLEILDRDGFMCRVCESDTNTLHVHHKCYLKSTDPWDYPDDTMVTVCEECHLTADRMRESIMIKVARLDHMSLAELGNILDGILDFDCDCDERWLALRDLATKLPAIDISDYCR